MIPVPRDLLDSLLDYLRQQYDEREDLWARNLLVHFQAIRERAHRLERR